MDYNVKAFYDYFKKQINGVIRNAKGLLKKDRERKKTIDDVHILLILGIPLRGLLSARA